VLLTGELEAVESVTIQVPRTSEWRVQVRWIAEDGATVKRGDKLVDFDNTSFAGNVEERRLAVLRARRTLDRKRAEVTGRLVQSEVAVESARIELAKAELDASVPKHLLSERDYQDRLLALDRTRSLHAKAIADLDVQQRASESEIRVVAIELEKARNDLAEAEESIDALSVEAPHDGIFIVAYSRRESRKIQPGDNLWHGLPVGEMPLLERMRVKARLSDVDDGKVAVGMGTMCTLDTYPDLSFEGTITAITPVAREPHYRSRRTFFEVDVAIEPPDTERMRPGMSVKVEVPLPELDDVLLVPRAALDLGAEPPRVRLRDGGWRELRLGACSALYCAVEDGIRAGTALAPKDGTT
jgi:hypothetical protein